jgi:hypothetical protein
MKRLVVFELMMIYLIHQLYALDNYFFVQFQLIVFEVHQFVVRNEGVELLEDVFLRENKLIILNQ